MSPLCPPLLVVCAAEEDARVVCGGQPNFLLCQGLSMDPPVIISHYSLIGKELLEQMALETNAWDGVIFRTDVCRGGITS